MNYINISNITLKCFININKRFPFKSSWIIEETSTTGDKPTRPWDQLWVSCIQGWGRSTLSECKTYQWSIVAYWHAAAAAAAWRKFVGLVWAMFVSLNILAGKCHLPSWKQLCWCNQKANMKFAESVAEDVILEHSSSLNYLLPHHSLL